MSASGPLRCRPGWPPLSIQMEPSGEVAGSNWSPPCTLSRVSRKVSVPLPVLLTTKDSGRLLSGELAGTAAPSCHVTATLITLATTMGVATAETEEEGL